MILRVFALISLLSLSQLAFSQASMISKAKSMSNQQIWDALLTIDASGNTQFGKCKIKNAIACKSCACDFYFQANVPGITGNMGWPKNPNFGDSSGCMNGCWSGYTPAMCTKDIQANARAMLLDALSKNACGNSKKK